jgi:transcriptional regulator with XRE-family HTH domain
MNLSQRLRHIREQRGYSQTYVAKKLNINRKTYNGYENGRGTPSPETLSRLAELFEVSTDYLINGVSFEQRDLELEQLLAEFKRQLEGRKLTDEEKKMVLDAVTDAIWKSRESK